MTDNNGARRRVGAFAFRNPPPPRPLFPEDPDEDWGVDPNDDPMSYEAHLAAQQSS